MRITIIYDNEAYKPGLEAAWGFSCLVETDGQRLLFDTGGQGSILLKNMEILNLDVREISEIFISHGHWDHIGGLEDVLRLNRDVRVYLPGSCPRPREAQDVISVQGPLKISENFFSTGQLAGEEQSLAVKTERGLAVICGCSHPGVGSILKAASQFGRVTALIGGLHGFQEYELLADQELICACHCTQHQAEIMERYPDTAVRGGVGRVLEYG